MGHVTFESFVPYYLHCQIGSPRLRGFPNRATFEHTHMVATERQLLGMSDQEISTVDPVEMNLVVAKGIPSLADLDIAPYVALADEWGRDLAAHMKRWERVEYYP